MQKTKIKVIKYEKTQKAEGAVTGQNVHFRRNKLKKNKGEQKINRRKEGKMD